jgi:hypothetical protein
MLRIDADRLPTMATTPTLAEWELEQLRSVEHVIRLGHIHHVTANACALNPAKVEPSQRADPRVLAAGTRLADLAGPGLARLAKLGGEPLPA